MKEQKLHELLSNLHDVLEKTDEVDPDTRKLVSDLDEEINRLLETGSSGEEFDSVIDQAKAVETRFAVDHPVAESFLRQIIDTLARIGI
jgi:ABC-type transporter Mla subunit MlaD